MEFTAAQIAGFINGKIIGDPEAVITGVSPIERGEMGHLSFIAQDRFAHYINTTACSVLVVSENLLTKDFTSDSGKTSILLYFFISSAYLFLPFLT